MVKEFKIVTVQSGIYRMVVVELYKTRKKMLKAAENKTETKYTQQGTVQGITTGETTTYKTYKGNRITAPYVASIYVNREDLTMEILAHELMHAAWFIYGFDCVKKKDKASKHFNTAGEPIAYVYGELWEQLYHQIKKYILDK